MKSVIMESLCSYAFLAGIVFLATQNLFLSLVIFPLGVTWILFWGASAIGFFMKVGKTEKEKEYER